MKVRLKSTLAAITVLVALLVTRPGWTVPLEVYGRLPSLEQVSLSPDGTRLALIETAGNDRFLVIHSLDHKSILGKPLRIGSVKLRWIEWADDDRLLITWSETAMPVGLIGRDVEWFMLGVWDVDKQKMFSYPDFKQSGGRKIMNTLSGNPMVRRIDGHTVLFIPGIYVDQMTRPALFRVDLDTSYQKLIREGTNFGEGWLVDATGEVAVQEDYNQNSQHWKIQERLDGHLREVASGQAPIDVPHVLGFGPDPGTLLVESMEDGEEVWRLLSMKDGAFGPPMVEHGTLDWPMEDRQTYRMIGGIYTDDTAHYVFFDRHLRAQWQSVLDGYGGEEVKFVSASSDFSKMVVLVNGATHGYLYELVDLQTHRATPIGDVYQGIDVPLEVKRIDYKAADGLDIPAYLTFPRGKPAKNLPLIVLPHGGPAVRDTADFDWWAQALAAQGYLVLKPNYRGSTTTLKHTEAGYGEWGRKMQTDLSDGVRYLVKEGMVDPARVCIVGGSYGGYAALAGVTLDPGVYRCAVSIAGISDMKVMLKSEGADASHTQRYWERFTGASNLSDPLLDQISPLKHVDTITVPVMLIHGKDDSVVRFEQSTMMYDAMKHAKKDVEMVTLKNEDHWLSRSETRLQMLQSSIAFLRTHNPPD